MADNAIPTLPAAPVTAAGDNGDSTWILTVRCPHCSREHRHGWRVADSELGRLDRDALCGGGRYVLDVSGVIPHD